MNICTTNLFVFHPYENCNQEGEEVEFEVVEEGDGRRKAKGVTGPDGVHVQGAPRDSNYDDSGGDGWNDRF